MTVVVRSAPSHDVASLPQGVQRLRARILEAARRRDVEDLRVPLGWNEVPPLFGRGQKAEADPIAVLKDRSFDRRGAEMLAILEAVLTSAFVRTVQGPTISFLWPVFPVVPEVAPLPGQRLAPWRCVRFADLRATAPGGGPLVHRTSIGEDGTWHYFWTEPSVL